MCSTGESQTLNPSFGSIICRKDSQSLEKLILMLIAIIVKGYRLKFSKDRGP
jgi:hypothetical protein